MRALTDVSLELKQGSIVGLVGESGSGKSTLVRCLAALEQPDSGEVLLDGCDLFRLAGPDLRLRRRAVQLVFQSSAAALNPWLTLREIVAEPLAIIGIHRVERSETALGLMDSVGIPSSWHRRRPHELSGGQRQRVALARALAARPRVLLLDEVMSGLDLPVQRQIIELLLRVQQSESLAYLFVTHDLGMAAAIADEIAVMHGGRIVEYASARHLFSDPRQPYTRALLAAIPRLPSTREPDTGQPS